MKRCRDQPFANVALLIIEEVKAMKMNDEALTAKPLMLAWRECDCSRWSALLA
jgi:hypothetical protein